MSLHGDVCPRRPPVALEVARLMLDTGIIRNRAKIVGTIAGARAFLRQDAGMVNLQNEGLKYDPSLIWIDDADKQAKWYQQLKREWGAARAEGRTPVNPVEAVTLRWKS